MKVDGKIGEWKGTYHSLWLALSDPLSLQTLTPTCFQIMWVGPHEWFCNVCITWFYLPAPHSSNTHTHSVWTGLGGDGWIFPGNLQLAWEPPSDDAETTVYHDEMWGKPVCRKEVNEAFEQWGTETRGSTESCFPFLVLASRLIPEAQLSLTC